MMKYQLILLTLNILSLECSNKKLDEKRPFESFLFSYSDEAIAYSMKFTNSDTIFYQYHFDFRYDQPKHHKTFVALANQKDLETLDSFLTAIDFTAFDTIYFHDHLHDGASYKFSFANHGSKNWVYIYGDQGPQQLYAFSSWLAALEDRQKQIQIDTTIDFGDLRYVLPPPVPPPPTYK